MTKYKLLTVHDAIEDDLLSVPERRRQSEFWPKNEITSEKPSSFGLITRAYTQCIFMQMMDRRMRGIMSIFAAIMLGGAVLSMYLMKHATELAIQFAPNLGGTLFAVVLLLFCALMFIIATISCIRILRIDIFGPKDNPLIFNRKTRKVYKFAQEVPMFPSSYNLSEFMISLGYLPKYWIESLKPWPMVLVEYDWDCMGAEYQKHTSVSGNVVKTLHHFNLHVRENPTSDRVIGLVTPMSPMLVGSRESAAALWEFIRRFMEEGGPVLHPGDKPSPPHPKNLLQAAQLVAPYYWVALVGYAAWTAYYFWQHGDSYSIAGSSVAQLSAEILAYATYGFLYFILANWLAHTLGFDVELPEELNADAGAPLDLKQLAREAAATKPM